MACLTRRAAAAWAVALAIGGALPAAAQTGAQSAQPTPAPAESVDPLGRDTPRGTIAGFNLAVHREDFVSAARYMQLTPALRENAEQLARDLTSLIDRYYAAPVAALSNTAEGSLTDGLPPDRERVVLTIEGKPVDIGLVRVKDPQAGLVWLISSQSLAAIPEMRSSTEGSWFERHMPEALLDTTAFGTPVARWVVCAASLLIPLVVLRLLSIVFIVVARRIVTEPANRKLLDSWYAELRPPVVLVLALAIHLGFVPLVGFSLRFRVIYSRLVLAVTVTTATWLLWRLMALSFANARLVAQRKGQANVQSVLLLAERVCKAIVFLMAIFAILTIAGVDTTTALAGVGIGGVAVALGAQKSIENLLGGVLLITDRALAVGDTCSISNRVGVVEDITMRSVRLRTAEQTLLSVPAGMLSQSSLENFATRHKILIQSTLRLRYGTTAVQLRRLLAGIRALLDQHPDIEKPTSRAQLTDFGVRAIELELFAYVLTRDFDRFLAVREELLLQIATLVESSGTSFALPTVVYQEPATEPNGPRTSDNVAAPRRTATNQGA